MKLINKRKVYLLEIWMGTKEWMAADMVHMPNIHVPTSIWHSPHFYFFKRQNFQLEQHEEVGECTTHTHTLSNKNVQKQQYIPGSGNRKRDKQQVEKRVSKRRWQSSGWERWRSVSVLPMLLLAPKLHMCSFLSGRSWDLNKQARHQRRRLTRGAHAHGGRSVRHGTLGNARETLAPLLAWGEPSAGGKWSRNGAGRTWKREPEMLSAKSRLSGPYFAWVCECVWVWLCGGWQRGTRAK